MHEKCNSTAQIEDLSETSFVGDTHDNVLHPFFLSSSICPCVFVLFFGSLLAFGVHLHHLKQLVLLDQLDRRILSQVSNQLQSSCSCVAFGVSMV